MISKKSLRNYELWRDIFDRIDDYIRLRLRTTPDIRGRSGGDQSGFMRLRGKW